MMRAIRTAVFIAVAGALAAVSFQCLGNGPATRPVRPTPDVVRLDPLTPVEISGRWGYANTDGEIVIDPVFDDVQEAFTEDRAYARVGRLRGFIDRDGKWRAGPKEWNIGEYKEGRAKVGRYVGEEFKWGFIDGDGNEVIPPQWDAARWFVGGVAQVGNETWISRIKTSFADINMDVDWHYIDRDGNRVEPGSASTRPSTRPSGE